MTRLLGEPQNPRIFWLVLLLAMMLLVGVSARPANAMAGAEDAALARDVSVLLALGEALQQSFVEPVASPVHPELADGGSDWLKSASVRRVRSLQRKLAELEAVASAEHALERQRLSLEADRLSWELLAAPSGEDHFVRLGRSFARLGPVRFPAQAEERSADTTPPARIVRVLRGTGL